MQRQAHATLDARTAENGAVTGAVVVFGELVVLLGLGGLLLIGNGPPG